MPRFEETDVAVAADQPELSPVPTAESLPPLQLESADSDSAKALFADVKAMLSA